MDIRLGYHLNQRHAAAVEIDNRALALVVQQLACVFLKMNALKADTLRLTVDLEIDIAVFTDRYIELRNLICLRQIRIEIVLSVGLAQLVDAAVGRNTHLRGIVDNLLVEHRQRARLTRADRAHMCIDFCAECSAASAENLCLGRKLGMDLQADDWLVSHDCCSSLTARRCWTGRMPFQMPDLR